MTAATTSASARFRRHMKTIPATPSASTGVSTSSPIAEKSRSHVIAGLGTPNPKKPRPGSIPGAVRLSSYVKCNGLWNAHVLKSRSGAIPTATPAVYASPRRSQSARAIAYAPSTKPTNTSGCSIATA